MQTKIIVTVRDTKNPTIKTARITSKKLLPFIGKEVELTIKVLKNG